jgi:leucyl/phenylalanyl-tRNA--protein transferase
MDEPGPTLELLVEAYRQGVFPMARSRHGPTEWLRADPRALLPLSPPDFRVRRSLAKRVRSGRFAVTFDAAFHAVIEACAEPRPESPDTWLNDELIELYKQMHRAGLAHSVEAWLNADHLSGCDRGELVGGLYGVSLGGAFFGESMFSRISEASQVCLVKLVEHLRHQGFALLDVQFANPHLQQFGVFEIPHQQYMLRLREALALPVTW